MTKSIKVEVVFAMPEQQLLCELTVPLGSTVGDVLQEAAIDERFPSVDTAKLPTGIWGRVCERSTTLNDGDRVEIYRELEIDPRSARRQLALAGRTMREARVSAKAPDPSESR